MRFFLENRTKTSNIKFGKNNPTKKVLLLDVIETSEHNIIVTDFVSYMLGIPPTAIQI